ncbi:protein kinase [Nannocystis pusilla]|uniref:Protein kinase n=1 Tax=Nannocystis pusilla TaxID=889268 RepID=A0A9X3EI44_9BACT|nr:protein kinase [Nannocystis pusilla]MCY1004508.1 protein kinase [Nannocystis pusilla]
MGEQSDPQSALVEFIAECFTSDELVRFVRSLSEGASLSLDMLQPPASIRDIAFHLVRMLERRALLDHTLFSALAQERPRQLERINLMMLSLLPGPGPVPKSLEGMLLCGGRYRMEELAAYGGFATLWRAWDNVTKSYVAIKILSREVPAKDYMWRRQRFITGTRRIAGLEHPHIARVLDAHRYEQGYDYCVQEYVEGHQLHKQIAARRLDSPIDIAASLLDIGEALALMHENGILHGDVSPKNIIIRPETGKFQAVLVDFDLVYAPAQDSMTVPTHGMPFTDPYSAPEWKAGLDQLDSRADIFSLGMTLVAIFAGCKPPASLNDPAAMDPGAFINKLSCNPLICETLYKACSLDRNRRYTNMRALCSDLRRALSEAQVWRASGRSFAEGQRALDAAKPVEPEPPLLPTAMPVAAPRTRQTDVTRGPSFEYEWLKTTKNGVVRPRLLGSGRFGKVFAALQTSATMPARPVAIKLLHDHADLRHERLFHQEIMLIASFRPREMRGSHNCSMCSPSIRWLCVPAASCTPRTALAAAISPFNAAS